MLEHLVLEPRLEPGLTDTEYSVMLVGKVQYSTVQYSLLYSK